MARYMCATLDVHHWKIITSSFRICFAALIQEKGLYQSSISLNSTSGLKVVVDRLSPTRFHPGNNFFGSIWRNRIAWTSALSASAFERRTV